MEDNGECSNMVMGFLNGADGSLESHYYQKHGETLPLTYFGPLMNPGADGEFVRSLLARRDSGRSINILIHGEPGLGTMSGGALCWAGANDCSRRLPRGPA